jgi:hypothetical protein
MYNKRIAAKVDRNQAEVVKWLRLVPGVSVEVGYNDILVGYKGRTYWYEIKDPSCANKKGEVFQSSKKKSQIKLEEHFAGHYKMVTTANEILKDIGILK